MSDLTFNLGVFVWCLLVMAAPFIEGKETQEEEIIGTAEFVCQNGVCELKETTGGIETAEIKINKEKQNGN